ncbi:hypothetical protein MBGDF03_00608 [Thermoplasmatales archaeon SCGC AB-540-F20]|nr:hypothetical protein MBGDF03_00608 [Thermoplasmatales archaeon SCGC AB-540-F20]
MGIYTDIDKNYHDMGMKKVKEIDNWLYRIELLEGNTNKKISYSKRKKNVWKYHE